VEWAPLPDDDAERQRHRGVLSTLVHVVQQEKIQWTSA
jgi:hypothetical protein